VPRSMALGFPSCRKHIAMKEVFGRPVGTADGQRTGVWFLKRYNSFAMAMCHCPTFHPVVRGITDYIESLNNTLRKSRRSGTVVPARAEPSVALRISIINCRGGCRSSTPAPGAGWAAPRPIACT
jgi:hypothetical protein